MNNKPVWSWFTSLTQRDTHAREQDLADLGTAFGLDASMEGHATDDSLTPWAADGANAGPIKEERSRP